LGSLTFFFDVCIGRRLPKALQMLAPPFAVEYHGSEACPFAHDMPDDEWLADIGKRGWIALSFDRRFHRQDPAENAIRQHGVGCFYLWGAQAPIWDTVRFFVRHSDKIMNLAEKSERPFVFRLSASGEVHSMLKDR
jgi:PIN domain-containing protein